MSADNGIKVISTVVAAVVNGAIFASMAYAGFLEDVAPPPEPEPETEFIDVSVVEGLPKLGVPRPEHMLPRIHGSPEAPPVPEEEAVNLARKKAEQEEEEARQKKADAEKKAEAEKKRKAEEEVRKARRAAKKARRAARRRKSAMAAALSGPIDVRADDEDAPEGVPWGVPEGTVANPTKGAAYSAYVSLLSSQLQRQLKMPSVTSSERRRLEAHVFFKINRKGKVVGTPRLDKASGNRFFDQAALRAVKAFGEDSELKITMPRNPQIKKLILNKGITAIVKPPRA